MSRNLVLQDPAIAELWATLHTVPPTIEPGIVIALKKAIEGSTEVGGGGGSGPTIPPLPYGGGTGGTTPPVVTWPQYVKVKGPTGTATIEVYAPLNPLYEPQQSAITFGGPGYKVAEPSNGMSCNPPQPLRSPAGFPLFYALGAGRVPVGAPRVYFGDAGFANDTDLLAWIARRPGYEAALLATKDNAWQAIFDRMARPTVQEAEVVMDPVIETVPGNAP